MNSICRYLGTVMIAASAGGLMSCHPTNADSASSESVASNPEPQTLNRDFPPAGLPLDSVPPDHDANDGLPKTVDLRPVLIELGLTPRPQGARGTCSIFTTCSALEFALARQSGQGVRMSPEYLNWAGARASGLPSDGNFFHNALKGWEESGLCCEASMPYAETYDPDREPSPDAAAEARRVRDLATGVITVHWIVPWVPDRFGVNDEQFGEIRKTLAHGYPVAAGSGHSRLLVGYRDDMNEAGGGVFLTLDSALNRFDAVTYEFVRRDVADVFWVEFVAPATTP